MMSRQEPFARPVSAEGLQDARLIQGSSSQLTQVPRCDRLMKRIAQHECVMGGRRHPCDMPQPVLQRACQVVIDLGMTERQRSRAGRWLARGAGGDARRGYRCRAIERLGDERRRATTLTAFRLHRVAQDQLVPGTGHGHEAQASLLRPGRLLGHRISTQRRRQRNAFRAAAHREAALDEAQHEHHPEFQALGLVHREHWHRVPVHVRVVGGRLLARIQQRPQVGQDRLQTGVVEQRRAARDDLEQAGDPPQWPVITPLSRPDKARIPAAAPEMPVQHIPGRVDMRRLDGRADIREQSLHRCPGRAAHAQETRGHCVQVGRRLGVCHDPQERQQLPYLGG